MIKKDSLQVWTTGTMGELSPVSSFFLNIQFRTLVDWEGEYSILLFAFSTQAAYFIPLFNLDDEIFF